MPLVTPFFNTAARQVRERIHYTRATYAGLVDEDLHAVSFASSTWEKYHHGYWLKEMLFRRLYQQFDGDSEKQAALKGAYFTGDFDTMGQWMVTP
jgi:hypothetical protein